jgi:predicted nucleic acid-binding protein
VTVHLDTSALIDALTGPRRSLDILTALAGQGHRLTFSTIVLYEWLRGPRTRAELRAQEELFPREAAVAFGAAEADLAARLCTRVRRARGAKSIWPLRPAPWATAPRSGR